MKKNKENPIAVAVKTTRKSLGLTQEEMAKRADVGLKSVRAIEQGYLNVNITTLLKVLDLLSLKIVITSKERGEP